MKKRFNLGYYLSEGVRGIFLHGFMSFAAVASTVACLLIMGSFVLVALNLGNTIVKLEQENEILAYIDESLTEEEARAIEVDLYAIDNVLDCEFVTRQQAMDDFLADKENNSLYKDVPVETFRHRFAIRVESIEDLAATVAAVAAVDGIEDVSAMLELSDGFLAVRNIAGGIAVILIVVLLVISLFIISNTIRLATFARREEIAIMKMVGATNWFIRWPFIWEGLILGVLGAVLAFFLQWGVYYAIMGAISNSDTISLIAMVPFQNLALSIGTAFLGTGLVIGGFGSFLAIRKFLKV